MKPVDDFIPIKNGHSIPNLRVFFDVCNSLKFLKDGFCVGLALGVNRRLDYIVIQEPSEVDAGLE